jgi:hypothetical protein
MPTMIGSGVFIGTIAASITHVAGVFLPAEVSKMSKYTVLIQKAEMVSKLSKQVVLIQKAETSSKLSKLVVLRS